MPSADIRIILTEAARTYIEANMSSGMASWYKGEVESYIPGLIDALLAGLTAHNLEIK